MIFFIILFLIYIIYKNNLQNQVIWLNYNEIIFD
jgi:hypothetical protein